MESADAPGNHRSWPGAHECLHAKQPLCIQVTGPTHNHEAGAIITSTLQLRIARPREVEEVTSGQTDGK